MNNLIMANCENCGTPLIPKIGWQIVAEGTPGAWRITCAVCGKIVYAMIPVTSAYRKQPEGVNLSNDKKKRTTGSVVRN